eukprot:6481386-Amphidinium_carterae.2
MLEAGMMKPSKGQASDMPIIGEGCSKVRHLSQKFTRYMVQQVEPELKKELIVGMEKADKSVTTKLFEFAVGASGEDALVFKAEPEKYVQQSKAAYAALGKRLMTLVLDRSHRLNWDMHGLYKMVSDPS